MKKMFEKDGTHYWVRFFDPESLSDLSDLKEITTSKSVRKWMTDIYGVKHTHYKQWMREQGKGHEFLFALAGEQKVHGFVYVYPSDIIRGRLEISYAKGENAPSGLMSKAIRLACELVAEYVFSKRPAKKNPPIIIAEIERDNIPSIKVVEKAGFVQIRKFDDEDNGVWQMNWE
jgi:RimJ/RimL family protein N-acetyltransferase